MQNFREFDAGPDPFGATWHVRFKWLQTAISIRHSNSVDVKFLLESGSESLQKTVSIPLPELTELAKQTGSPVSDPWCARLAAQHLRYLIESGEDMEKDLVYVPWKELAAYDKQIREWERQQVSRIRGAA